MKTNLFERFADLLLNWGRNCNDRPMPWKGEKDPYKIWLSEIILQQTRVNQGWIYYERFVQRFPSIFDLASASDNEVFKLWEGLGYYNRCKNLLHTARYICNELNGQFPNSYDQILQLKGIGSYTAAAICSFAFNQNYSVLDGNVFRVLSRVWGVQKATDTKEGLSIFKELAQKALAKDKSAEYNQTIMDFGATVCKPFSPLCVSCPMQSICWAYQHAQVNQLPIKEKTLKRKTRFFTWFFIEVENYIYVHKRTDLDIWENLHEFYLMESDHTPIWSEQSITKFAQEQFNSKLEEFQIFPTGSQLLTHQTIKANLIYLQFSHRPDLLKNGQWLKIQQIQKLGFPKILRDFLQNYLSI